MADCGGLLRRFFRSFLLLAVLGTAESLYENQIGKVDWKRSFVGRTVLAQYDESSQNSRRYFSVTKSGVLASVNTRTGKIEWRQVFTDGLDAMIHESSKLVTYHSGSGILRSWNTAAGYLVWESSLGLVSPTCPGVDMRVSSYCKRGVFLQSTSSNSLVLMDGAAFSVVLVQLSSGQTAWSRPLTTGHTYYGLAVDGGVYAVALHSREVFVLELRLDTGAAVSNRSVPASFFIDDQFCTMSGTYVLCVNPQNEGSLDYFSAKTDLTFSSVTLESLGIKSSPSELVIRSLWKPSSKVHLITMETKTQPFRTWVLRISGKEISKLWDFEERSQIVYTKETNTLAVTTLSRVGTFALKLYSVPSDGEGEGQGEILSSEVQWPVTEGPPKTCLAHVYQRTDGSHGYRLIVFTEDDAILQIKHPGDSTVKNLKGDLGWTREEAPAMITGHMIWDLLQLDMPPQASDKMTGFSQFVNRLQYQAVELQEFFKSMNYNSLVNMFTSKRAKVFSRDGFNVRKLLLLSTEAGKLFGVLSDEGEFLWKRWISNIGVYNDGSHLLFKLRGLTHPPLDPLAVLFAPGKSDCDGTVVLQFNPLTGQDALPPKCEPFRIIQAVSLPIEDSQHVNIILLALADGTYTLYPQSDENVALLQSFRQDVYLYRVSKEDGVAEGFRVKTGDAKSSKGLVECDRVWSINFTAASQKIVSIATRSQNEVVNAQAKVSGEHMVLFKYLNPNLIAIATETEDDEKSSVDIYVIDTVSGHFVSHTSHRQHKSPVHMVLSENWLLYYLYNNKAWRHELVVMEMYENITELPSEMWSSLKTQSSPVTLKQSYILPKPIVTMATTQTLRGIAERNIIFGLSSGHLFSTMKMLFDPRRAMEQIPGLYLPPYFPEIGVNASDYLNYNQTIASLRTITTHPTGLESTSLVVSFGLDLYVTLVSPSKSFDQLADDFDYQLVGLVLGALVVGVLVLSRLSHSKNIRKMWK